MILQILGAVLALAVGLYIGMGGRYRPDFDEIDRTLGEGGRTRKVKRHFTPLGWLRMGGPDRPSRVRRMSRGNPSGRFKTVLPNSGRKKEEG